MNEFASNVFVLNHKGKPLMPTTPRNARVLLKDGLAKVVSKVPFTIKLNYVSKGYKQPVVAGMDTGSKTIGVAAITNNRVVYQAEVQLRQDINSKMQQRASYRRNRRGRKTRYRQARFDNRNKRPGWLAPSLQSKVNSHLREKRFVESILPVSEWKVETASFDIHKISNPNVEGVEYQNGAMKDFYNVKAYILHRDNYTCQSKQKTKHGHKLHVHHIKYRSQGGTDTPTNLITLCETCHDNLHKGIFSISGRISKTKHATEVSIIKSSLTKQWSFTETFGYETKYKREQILGLPKTHYNDAISICIDDEFGKDKLISSGILYLKKHVAKGDYQQTSGSRSEKRIPTGKLFGLRKFDYIKTDKGIGFIKGKRSKGFFSLMDIDGNKIHESVNIKMDCIRIRARSASLLDVGYVK